MYTIKVNGSTLYSPAFAGGAFRVLAPKLDLDVNANGSCTFVLPPGNRMYNQIRRRKDIVTVHQDGEEIFRGRVLDTEVDQFKQKSVYCEGVRSFLNDSQAAPHTYHGTPRGFLEKLITEHNAQVEEDKHFTLGQITIDRADEDMECENVAYWETFREMDEKLLSAYGGYLKARHEGGVLFLDWLKDYGRSNTQEIRFAVNLLDLRDKQDAAEIFTILRPLGASILGDDGEYAPPLTIESVNDGNDYIQDDEAIAQYGRIWRTQTWNHIEDPAKLLEKAQEFMKIGAEMRTITLKAIDMHFLSGSAQAIHVGDKAHIVSPPHGLDLEKVCCRINLDLVNPEETTYTFGEPPRALTDNFIAADNEINSMTGYRGGGGGRSPVQEEMNGILRWAKMSVNEKEAMILMNAGEIDSLEGRTSQAEADILGAYAQIRLKASQEEVDDLGMRMSAAGINIRGDIGEIEAFATLSTVNDLGEDVNDVSVRMSAAENAITLKADKIDLQGYVTASQLETEFSDFQTGISDTLYVRSLSCSGFSASSMSMNGSGFGTYSQSVVTGGSISIGLAYVPYMKPDGTSGTLNIPASFTFNPTKKTIYYWSWE